MNRYLFITGLITFSFLWGGKAFTQQSLPAYFHENSMNSVVTLTSEAPVSDPDTLLSRRVRDVKCEIEYYDGLGRLLQTVDREGSLTTGGTPVDLVKPVLLDQYGRETYKYLPFAANSSGGNLSITDGCFKTNPYDQQQQFMQSLYDSQGESNYYTRTIFDSSPEGDILETFAPGKSWAGSESQTDENNRKSVKNKYWTNTSLDSVRVWDVADGSGAGTISSLLTETHCDDYEGLPSGLTVGYKTDWDGYFDQTSTSAFPYPAFPFPDASQIPKTLVAWERTKALGSASTVSLPNVKTYDFKQRLIQTQSINITGGVDVTTTEYNWADRPLIVVRKVEDKNGGTSRTTVTVTPDSWKGTYEKNGEIYDLYTNRLLGEAPLENTYPV